ncbi:MAG: transcription elongation factor Spt5 [archaeon]
MISLGIYAIRTTANKEKNVASKLVDRIERDKFPISSIIVPGLKGYVLVEGDKQDIDKAYRGVAHARGLVEGETSVNEIEHFLAPKPAATSLEEGYTIEVTSGPFKGEKAKIIKVDNTKNEVTIELLEATVPIPITVPAESVRVLEREGKEKKDGAEEAEEKKGKADKEEKTEEIEPETIDPFKL